MYVIGTTLRLVDRLCNEHGGGVVTVIEAMSFCHAAIISREMKKPCIIGTKIATKVFKDGDRVEVDAIRGIVTVIKNQ